MANFQYDVMATYSKIMKQRARKYFAAIFFIIVLPIFYCSFSRFDPTDSRYVIASSDNLLRSGSFNLWPVIDGDKDMPLSSIYHGIVNGKTIPVGDDSAIKASNIKPFPKEGGGDYYVLNEVLDIITNIYKGKFSERPNVLPLFPIMPSVVMMPVSLVTTALGIPVFDGFVFHEGRNRNYQGILAAVLSSISVAFIYGTARFFLPLPLALGLAAWLAFGPLFSSASRSLWSDTIALPLSFAALYIFSRVILASRPMRHWSVIIAAAISFAFMMKPSYAIPGALLGMLVITFPTVHLRQKCYFILTCCAFMLIFVSFSFGVYGTIFPPYHIPARASTFNGSNLLGVIFSPSRGVLWFTPSLLIACTVPLFVWRDRTVFLISVAAVFSILAAVQAVAGFAHWWGGYSFGPRLLQFDLPIVALLLILFLSRAMTRNGLKRFMMIIIFFLVTTWEAFVHISGVASPNGWMWNTRPVTVDAAPQRLWDWSDPQFLAAFRPARMPGIAVALPKDGWVRMASVCSNPFAGEGISGREPGFRWTDGTQADVYFANAPENARRFAIDVLPLIETKYPVQRLTVELNGTEIGRAVLTQPHWTRLQFDVPPGTSKDVNTITLKLPDAHPPGGGSQDIRRLGVAIAGFVVTATSDASSLPTADACK